MNDWHYQHNGETKGPVDDNQLKALADAGVVNAGTPVWKTGYENWVPLSHTDFAYLDTVPPPPTAGRGGAALSVDTGATWGADVVVDDRGMWQMFTDALTKNYVNFYGRARRKEFWSYYLFLVLTILVIVAVFGAVVTAAGGPDTDAGQTLLSIGGAVYGIVVLGLMLPTLAMWVRRLHDLGLSGWLFLIWFTGLGAIALIIMALIPTQFGPNKHGPAPKAPHQA